MQDFTKLDMSKLNDSKTLNLTKKSNWLNDRLNRDNFWNLMFFLLMLFGSASSLIILHSDFSKHNGPYASAIFFLTLIAATILLNKTSNITFDEKQNLFTLRDGRKLNKSAAEFIVLVLFSISILVIISFLLPTKSEKDSLLDILVYIISSFPILLPTSYCIIRNFPISVFFHKNAWYRKNQNNSNQYEGPYDGFNLTCNPSNSWHISNIHHDRHS